MSPDSNSGPALIGIEPTIYPNNELTQRPLSRAKFLKNTWYVAMPSEELKELATKALENCQAWQPTVENRAAL